MDRISKAKLKTSFIEAADKAVANMLHTSFAALYGGIEYSFFLWIKNFLSNMVHQSASEASINWNETPKNETSLFMDSF